ncbi:hypothetical protein NYR77_07500 [Actinobacillus equuli subsp. haemolyticus]|uniref:hypothetical protein n=1 Tax=Actinobacillus equuli TaxID=718 RepID=UPI0024421F08|nr:hypothetical protein [Actinobacillus equuli]WGE66832.1 hypothetical protein NYR77_07500 [Actinobacillus equuli subsp. haemolyticus]
MALLIFSLICGGVFWKMLNHSPRLLHLGELQKMENIQLDNTVFYVEETRFATNNLAVNQYQHLAMYFYDRGKLLRYRHDWYDLCLTVFQFEDCSMWLWRRGNHIRLVKSQEPMELAEFEKKIAPIAYS